MSIYKGKYPLTAYSRVIYSTQDNKVKTTNLIILQYFVSIYANAILDGYGWNKNFMTSVR